MMRDIVIAITHQCIDPKGIVAPQEVEHYVSSVHESVDTQLHPRYHCRRGTIPVSNPPIMSFGTHACNVHVHGSPSVSLEKTHVYGTHSSFRLCLV